MLCSVLRWDWAADALLASTVVPNRLPATAFLAESDTDTRWSPTVLDCNLYVAAVEVVLNVSDEPTVL